MMFQYKKNRYWEIDSLRGLAIISMVLYHLIFDLYYFYEINFLTQSNLLIILGKLSAITFLILVGVSLSLKRDNVNNNKLFFVSITKRSLFILFWAYLITLITYIFTPNETIFFGVLHLIGTSMLISIPLLLMNSNTVDLLFVIIIIISSKIITNINTSHYLLIPIGVTPSPFSSFDYFPLLPWLSYIIVGIILGNIYRPYRKKHTISIDIHKNKSLKLSALGQRSLLIYLVHQPAILFVLYIIKNIHLL